MATLVTGAKGFLGAAVTRALVVAGERVVCLDVKPTPGRLHDLADRVTLIGGGIPDVDGLVSLMAGHGVRRVAHLVYAAPHDAASLYPALGAMVFSAADVFEAAMRTDVERVAFASSIHYYGEQASHGEVLLDEEAPSLATTLYGIGKCFDESVARAYADYGGLPALSLRVPAVYGPGAAVGARGVNVAAVEAARGRRAILPYTAQQQVSTAHVDDVAGAFVRALETPAPEHLAYNVGGHTTSYQGIAEVVHELVPGAEIDFTDDAAPSDLPYLIDGTRIRAELGVEHRPLADGMREVVEYARSTETG